MSNILKPASSFLSLAVAGLLLSATAGHAKSHKPKPSPSPTAAASASTPVSISGPAPAGTGSDVAALVALKSKDPSNLVPPNAGSHGFVKVDPVTKRLVFQDGTPARFYGVNFAEYLNECDRKVSTEEMVAHLKDLQAMGVNVIRFQTYDNRIQKGVLGTGINAVALDNRDRFIAEAKKLGIYFHMSMNTSKGKGGARDLWEKSTHEKGSKEAVVMIDSLIKSQHTFAVNLLNHVNPYTGLAYKDEPAILSIQLGNEQHAYSRPSWAAWSTFTGAYADEIRGKWNRWLVQTYGDRDKLATAWGKLLKDNEDPAKGTVAITDPLYPMWNQIFTPTARQKDAVLFGNYIQDQFYKGMRDCIRNEAGDKNHIISDNGWVRGDDLIRETAQKDLDLMDVQHYWPHSVRHRMATDDAPLDVSPIKTCGINILNSLLSAREVNGKKGPGFVTEYNSHKDNKRAFQVVPVHAIMAQLTGIDGAALWTYTNGSPDSLFDTDHWFSFNREEASLNTELMPFIVGTYLWRTGIAESISQKTISELATWDNTNPIGLSVDYDASLKQATSVKPYKNEKEGVDIDFPHDKLTVSRDDVIFYTGSGPVKTYGFDFTPENDAPYLLAVFPVDGKPLATSEEWRVFTTANGTMKLKRSDLTMWRPVGRGYGSTHGDNGKGKLTSTTWAIHRPANALYYDLKTETFSKALMKASRAAKGKEDDQDDMDQ